jgi:hypothetical protein
MVTIDGPALQARKMSEFISSTKAKRESLSSYGISNQNRFHVDIASTLLSWGNHELSR